MRYADAFRPVLRKTGELDRNALRAVVYRVPDDWISPSAREFAVEMMIYTAGAKRAAEEVGFPLLLEYPDLHGNYQSHELFPIFRNRVMNRRRPDFPDYLRSLDLPDEADSIAILSANGGRRETDSYEVFPKIEIDTDGRFQCRFFLHGSRYVNAEARIKRLRDREPLSVTLGQANPVTGVAVQIRTTDHDLIGWSPRYLVPDLSVALDKWPNDCRAMVVRLNPRLVPRSHRVQVKMQGRLQGHEPMSGRDFRPLVP